jgi:hypothetical protein
MQQSRQLDTGTGSLAMGQTVMQQNRQSENGTGRLEMGETVMQQYRRSGTGTCSLEIGTGSHAAEKRVRHWDRQSCNWTDSYAE